ncbi:uncharacterized protein [Palaemon carinicauda]|uniref:uncharacterized protein n=1 Tax=Palaemon carinicauda TaxID=392227 RepID=UPI0035B67D86
MPRRKTLPTLVEICLKCYGKHFIWSLLKLPISKHKNCDGDEKNSIAERRDSLLKMARAYVLEYTIMRTRKELLKVFIGEILDMKSSQYWEILRDCLVVIGGEWIQELDFICDMLDYMVPIEIDQPELILSQTLFQNHSWSESLVSLKLPDLRDFEIVKAVGSHCYNLQYLDISTSFQTGPGVGHATCLMYLYGAVENSMGCPKLKTIALPLWRRNLEVIDHVVKMIQFMPDLQVIRNVDTRLVAIKYMNAMNQLCPMKLTEFEEWEKDTFREDEYNEVNEALGKLFPNVKRYASFCWYYGYLPIFRDQGLVKMQSNFTCLQVIEFYKYNGDLIEDINSMDSMPSVKVFKLYERDDIVGFEKVNALSAVFPNLEKLVLHSECYCVDNGDDLLEQTIFSKLNTLELNKVAELDVRFLQIFFEKCPVLRTLELFCVDPSYFQEAPLITDEFVQSLSSSMVSLEKVTIARDPRNLPCTFPLSLSTSLGCIRLMLTYASILRILHNCPNLRVLGDLGFWSVTNEQIYMLNAYIAQNNWDLTLVNNSSAECGYLS